MGMLFGFGLWYLVWYVIPEGFLPFASWHYEGNQLVVDDLLGSIGKVIGFFAMPIIGGVVATSEDRY